jgi:hypothetical protein
VLEGEELVVTVLADARGFTSDAEQVDPVVPPIAPVSRGVRWGGPS